VNAGGHGAGGGSAGTADMTGTSGAGGSTASAGAPGVGGAGASSAGAAGSAGANGAAANGGRAGGSSGAGGAGLGGAAGAGVSGSLGDAGSSGSPPGPLSVLVFSKTVEFRHDSIPDGRAALMSAASDAGWTFSATEDASVFNDDGLASIDVVVFLSTTGDVLDDSQQAAFERFIRAGRGFVGIHSASDTEYDWAFYGELVGAYFREHPAVQEATIRVADAADPTMAGLPDPWTRTDEWYAFKDNPRANVHVLMTLDETSYAPGTATMGSDHPIAWLHEYEGGRAFYTALGHTKESYADPTFVRHLTQAISWAGGR